MEFFRPPLPLVLSENMAECWKRWYQQFDIFMIATGLEGKVDDIKTATLLNLIGAEGLAIYNSFDFVDQTERKIYLKVVEKFEAYFVPCKNLIYEHFRFFTRSQLAGETIDQFVTDLKKLADSCEFSDRDTMLLDRVVLGTIHHQLQQKMIQEPDLTLDKALNYCRSYEISQMQIKHIQKATNQECDTIVEQLNAVRLKDQKTKYGECSNRSKSYMDEEKTEIDCNKCGRKHRRQQCPAYGRTCNKCQRKGHYAKWCRYKFVGEIHVDQEDTNSEPNFDLAESDGDDLIW